MAGIDIPLKRGETVPVEALLQDGNGAALDLTGATSIAFQAKASGATALKIDRAATVVDPVTAHVRAMLTATDTDTLGSYKAEWRVTYAGGYRLVPEDSYLTVKVADHLAP